MYALYTIQAFKLQFHCNNFTATTALQHVHIVNYCPKKYIYLKNAIPNPFQLVSLLSWSLRLIWL